LSHHGITKLAYDRFSQGVAHWDMLELGWKYNMSNISAGMLLPQLRRIGSNLERRTELANIYREAFASHSGLALQSLPPNAVHAHHLFPIWLREHDRDSAVAALRERGVECAVNYRPIHLLTYFRERFGFKEGMFPVSEWIGARTVSLPIYPKLPAADAERVARDVIAVLRR
jgi:UDP-4-amino-4-deoxy-L-arabinose-oxoglutarate aminotransferase